MNSSIDMTLGTASSIKNQGEFINQMSIQLQPMGVIQSDFGFTVRVPVNHHSGITTDMLLTLIKINLL